MDESTVKGVAQAVSAVVSVAALSFGAYQWSAMRNRTKLKADLEILRLFQEASPGHECCQSLKQRIETRMERAYPASSSKRTDLDKSDLLAGLLLAVGGTLSLSYASSTATSWDVWLYIAGAILTLVGFGTIYKGFERKLT